MARIESAADEVRRIDRTGTTWFAAAILAVAISVAGARVAGWSPLEIATPAAILWWTCAAALSVGIAALAWAGCPVLGFPLAVSDRQKSLCVRAGVVLLMLGGAGTSLVELLS